MKPFLRKHPILPLCGKPSPWAHCLVVVTAEYTFPHKYFLLIFFRKWPAAVHTTYIIISRSMASSSFAYFVSISLLIVLTWTQIIHCGKSLHTTWLPLDDVHCTNKWKFQSNGFLQQKNYSNFFFPSICWKNFVHRCHPRHHSKHQKFYRFHRFLRIYITINLLAKDKQKSDQPYAFHVFFWLNRYWINPNSIGLSWLS